MLRKLLWTFLALFLLLAAAGSWLMMTQSGLNATVSLAQKLMPALEIQQAQGRLSDRVELSGIRYRPEQTSGAEIESLALSWQPSALLKSTLSISELTASGIDIFTVETPQAEDSEPALPDMSLPLRIELAKLSLRDINIIDESGTKTGVLQSLTSTTTVDYNSLKISQFELHREDLSASLQGDISLQAPHQTDLSYVLKLEQLLESPFEVKGQLQGDTQHLTLEQTVSAPLASSQTLIVTDLLEQLHWSLTAQADKLNLGDILPEQSTRLTRLNVTGEGDLGSLSASLDTLVHQTDLPEIALKADIQTDDLESWSITALAELLTETRLNLDGTISLAGEGPVADFKANWQNLPWPLTLEDRLVTSTEGTLLFSGTQNDYRAQIKTVFDWQEEVINLAAEARGTMEQLTIESLDLKGFEGQLAASGLLDWHATPLQYELSANWQDMVLPASLTQIAVALKQGQIELQGSPEALSLTTRASLLLDGVEMAINADASGQTDNGFENIDLTIKLAEGSLRYQGQALWSGTSLMDGQVTLANFNPGVLAPDWPGALNGTAAIKVDNLADGLLIKAQDMDIRGELRQRPVSLSGAIDYSGTLIDAKQLLLKSGQSSLTANGQVKKDKVDFKWSLQSPDLHDFYPDFSGKLNASGIVQGTLIQPAINADIDGERLQFEGIEAGSVKGKVKLVLRENADIDSRLEFSRLKLPQFSADTLTLTLSGQQQAHQIKLDMQSDQLTLALAAQGGLDSGRWQGSLQTFDLSNDEAGQWSLSQRGELTLAADSQVIPEHCWRSAEGEFCLHASHSAQSWQAAGQFSQLPLSLFEAFAAELTQLQGMLRGQFSLAGGKDTAITGEGEIFLDNASVHLEQQALNQQKPVPLNNVALRYQIDADSTTASFHLEPELDGVSAINAELQTAGLDQLIKAPEQARLQGQVTTAIRDLSQLQLSHPAFNDIEGQLDMNLEISGTVSQPRINGQASLQLGQIAIIDAGIILREMQANVQGDLDRINFDFQARSGEGTLTGEGIFQLTESSWELTSMLKGRQLEVMNTPEALVIAEPDLTITMTPALTLVKGKVHIPEAELEPTQFNSTVSPSRDVVVVSNEQQQAEKGAVTELDITVSLGDKVTLKAMGFDGRLTGDIRVSGKTSDILVANGEIRIKEGSYQAYGQTLRVDDGSIRFAGGAIDNPELDIKAVRKGRDYKAGLHIEGFTSAPQVNLFSEPDMSQDDTLSYILLGKPLGQASATDAALLASAATGMGLKNGAIIGEQIASTFGLDEFSIAGDSAESAALQVGKYLSPKLYLSYGIGVFESVSTVELRYQLSKIWALKAESGTESGIDLLYTYERGGPE